MPKIYSTVFLLLIYMLLTGCGTQGPLYIPEQRYPQKVQDDDAIQKTPNVAPREQTTTN